ncbi:MAG: aldehyde dehydrogenase family protein, partial [Steroidobacterales bacterium]
MQLKDSSLLRDQCLIDGRWVGAGNGGRVAVKNPATGAVIAHVPLLDATATRTAIDAAAAAFPAWAARTAKERAVILRRWYELMMANQDDL